MDLNKNIDRAKKVIEESDAILITAGAGMGVDSGLPDFRGKKGFWRAYPIIKKLGISFIEMANPKWFTQNPELAWAFYGHRLNLYRDTTPHIGFKKLLELGESKKGGYFVFTSNVDGQFQKAGFAEDKINECHGSIHHLQCIKSCTHKIWSAKDLKIDVDMEKFIAKEPLPKCINCDKLARPNILMFFDLDWIEDRTMGQSYNFDFWLNNIKMNKFKLAIIEIGAGESIPTIRDTSEKIAKKYNATLIRINPIDYKVPNKKYISIPMGGLDGIEAIL